MSTHDGSTPNPDHVPPESNGGASDSGPEHPAPPNELPRWATKQSASTPFSDARMAAYIGPRWESTYRAKLSQFFVDPTFTVTWNWAAALGSPFWFLYRKLYAAGLLFMIVPNLVFGAAMANNDPTVLERPESPEAIQYMMMWMAVTVSGAIAAGGSANWLLFRRARAASLVVSMQQVPEDVAISRLNQLGGVSLRGVVVFCVLSIVFAMVFSSKGAP